ncbi:MAG: SCO family protein [Bacteriovoracaceae bacterium]|jgi:protein SCO1|nr:SCO family protein [Bacteriovoracaceae bacterium]
MKTNICIFILLLLLSCTPEAPDKRMIKARRSTLVTKQLGGDFILTRYLNNKTKKWSLSSSNGKIRIVYFGFTHCPDVCPTALTKLANKLKKLSSSEIVKVQPIFISVDYKRDTAKKVKEYVEYFSKSNIGLTGTEAEIKKITNQYGIYFKLIQQKDSVMGYTIDHTSRYIIINRNGLFYNSYSELDEIFFNDLKKLIGN